jgi:hypothetical protein
MDGDVGAICLWILIGFTALLVSVCWTRWLYQNNPEVSNDRKGYLQTILVFCLLSSCLFLTFAVLREDLTKKHGDPKPQREITLAGGGIICVATFAILLAWDCFCRGKAPHLVPAYWSTVALIGTCSLLIPGLTILSIHRMEMVRNDGTIEDYYKSYVEGLQSKGIGLVAAGAFIDLLVLLIWVRQRYVSERPAESPNQLEVTTAVKQ